MNKKIIAIICLTCMISIMFCGCAEKEINNIVYTTDDTHKKIQLYAYVENYLGLGGGTDVKIADECAILQKHGLPTQNDNAVKEMTVEYEGEKYTGSYSYTINYEYSDYTTDEYIVHDDQGKSTVYFEINPETGKMWGIGLYKSGNEESQKSDYKQYCREKAVAFASSYIDVDKYQMSEIEQETFGTIKYTFKRCLGDIKTQAAFVVIYKTNGSFCSYMAGLTEYYEKEIQRIGEEQAIETAKLLASEEAEKLVKEKMDYRYAAEEKYEGYEIDSRFIIILDDGSLGMIYNCGVEAWYKTIEDGEESMSLWNDQSTVLITTTEQ